MTNTKFCHFLVWTIPFQTCQPSADVFGITSLISVWCARALRFSMVQLPCWLMSGQSEWRIQQHHQMSKHKTWEHWKNVTRILYTLIHIANAFKIWLYLTSFAVMMVILKPTPKSLESTWTPSGCCSKYWWGQPTHGCWSRYNTWACTSLYTFTFTSHTSTIHMLLGLAHKHDMARVYWYDL